MSKFKVGDTLRRIRYANSEYGKCRGIGYVGTITAMHESYSKDSFYFGEDGWGSSAYYELVSPSPEEQAISLLTEKGYVVTPPPSPKEYWVNIHLDSGLSYTYTSIEEFELLRNENVDCVLIHLVGDKVMPSPTIFKKSI